MEIGIMVRDNEDNRDHSDTRDTCRHMTNTGHDMAGTRRALSDGYIPYDRRTDLNRRCAGWIVDIPKQGTPGSTMRLAKWVYQKDQGI